MPSWTGPTGANPALDAALDAADLDQLVRTQDARDAAFADLPDEDFWQRIPPMWWAIGGVGVLALLFVMPEGGRRR